MVRNSCSEVEKLCSEVEIPSEPTPEQFRGWIFNPGMF